MTERAKGSGARKMAEVLKLIRSEALCLSQISRESLLTRRTISVWMQDLATDGIVVKGKGRAGGKPVYVYRLSQEWGGMP